MNEKRVKLRVILGIILLKKDQTKLTLKRWFSWSLADGLFVTHIHETSNLLICYQFIKQCLIYVQCQF